jgi:hypothetical protein
MTTPHQKPAKAARSRTKSNESAQKRNVPEHFHSNREAVEMTIEILFGLGRIEKIDSATVTMARLLATAVDENPQSHGLWKQYRETVAHLRGIGDSDDADFAAYMEQLDAALRDTPPPGA